MPIDRIVSTLYGGTATLIIPSGLAAIVSGFTGKLDLPVSRDRSRAFLALLVRFAVIGGISMVAALFARRGLGHVYLTPTGFEIAELRRTSEGLGHPDDRAELTDGRALERLRNEQFDIGR